MTYPSGRIITYNMSNDKVISVLNNAANLAKNINYKPFGGMTSLIYGNGITGTTGYDNQYRITALAVGTILNSSYTDDANGNITGITNALEPTKNKSFTYDALDRLSTATASGIWGSLNWTYDGVGNRQTENSNAYIYAPNTNKLTGANGNLFGYDNNGNTTTEGTRDYIYNQNQRLIRVVDAGMTKGEYTYNGNGQRVKKVANGTTTIFHYNLGGQLIAESDNSWAITAEYVYLNSQPLAKIESNQVYYYHNDHLGTPQRMTDASATVVWDADYKPFGEATVIVSTVTNNLRFPGQYFDAETGLNYNYYRDYNPVIGRYVESDPIGQRGGLNPFIYTENNPINVFDPWGLTPPIYEPNLWNDGGPTQTSNNCYSYACNRPYGHPPNSKPQPGEASGIPLNPPYTCAKVKQAAMSDGLKEPNSCDKCPDRYHKVQLVVDPDKDYHWYRQDQGGSWSHKPGWGPVTNVDASGKPITNPSTANRDYSPKGGPNYRKDCGTLCAPD